jgi:glyoxylase-like metal-dependent hydrolase (beta-lactamase superfamily II)
MRRKTVKVQDNKYLESICDNIYLVSTPMKGLFPYCYSFLITGNQNILIDAGTDKDILRAIDDDTGIDVLVISHSHPDHIRSWDALSHRKLYLPEETPDTVFNLEQLGERYMGSPETGRHWVNTIAKMLDIVPFREPDIRFSHGTVIQNGPTNIEAIYAPGHLDDHYCFFEHNSGTLITTDIDFTSFGRWYGNPEGKIKPFRESIKKVMAIPYSRVCTSHKRPNEGSCEYCFNVFLSAFERHKNMILNLLGPSGRTLDEIVSISPFYNNRFMDKIIQDVFEKNMSLKNLEILMEEGRVYEKDGKYIAV